MGNIRIIGPRGSGKTTYLAALAFWPDKTRPGKKGNLLIEPVGDESKNLAALARNIILEGEALPPTEIDESDGIDALPMYSLGIEKKGRFKKAEPMMVSVRDYPGEIFDALADMTAAGPIHEAFIEECFEKDVDGCLILLADWNEGSDTFTSRALREFVHQMDRRGRLNNLRIAVAMSKCERGELWPGRLDPKADLFLQHLPETTAALEAIPRNNLRYYAVSTFGVLGRNDPRPNREMERGAEGFSMLRKTKQVKDWRPYGLLAPLQWLSHGG